MQEYKPYNFRTWVRIIVDYFGFTATENVVTM